MEPALVFLLFSAGFASSGELARRVYWGASFREAHGAAIAELTEGGPAARAGLEVGDVVKRAGTLSIPSASALARIDRLLPHDRSIELRVLRGGKTIELRISLPEYPRLRYDCCEVEYGSIESGGERLRTITTRPKNTQGRLASILFVGWLSCDSVEPPLEEDDGWAVLLKGLAEQRLITMRLDKPGVGDSEGDCRRTDYRREISAYSIALRTLAGRPDVDPRAIHLFGGSMGGATAPLAVAEAGIAVQGIAFFGSFAKTWFEHMMEHERRRLALAGDSQGVINERMRGFGELHSLILHGKLTPAQAAARRPRLASFWYDEPQHLYGRPIRFYQQAQDLNVLAAWESLDVRVLAMWGEEDWIMSREDHELVAAVANRRRAGSGRFAVIPKTDHFLMAEGKPDRKALELTLSWLAE